MKPRQTECDIYYEIHGEGEAVIFISGGFYDHHCWQEVLLTVKEKYQAIVMDNRASGLSVDTEEEYHVALLAKDVLRLMEHLRIDKAHTFA